MQLFLLVRFLYRLLAFCGFFVVVWSESFRVVFPVGRGLACVVSWGRRGGSALGSMGGMVGVTGEREGPGVCQGVVSAW